MSRSIAEEQSFQSCRESFAPKLGSTKEDHCNSSVPGSTYKASSEHGRCLHRQMLRCAKRVKSYNGKRQGLNCMQLFRASWSARTAQTKLYLDGKECTDGKHPKTLRQERCAMEAEPSCTG